MLKKKERKITMTQKQLEKEVPRIVKHLKQYFDKAGAKGAIIGNSGGKDCATVIGLAKMALGAENVYTVAMPCESIHQDLEDAKLVSKHFGVVLDVIDFTEIYQKEKDVIENVLKNQLCAESLVNLKPRLRMSILYTIAQTKGYLVLGTGNLCERYVGYFTKNGDGAFDYNPLAEFTVEEVYQIARFIGVPEKVLQKAPADGLGKLTDEQKLGVTYIQIAEVALQGKTEDEGAYEKIMKLHKATRHKFKENIYKRSKYSKN